ncbi:NUDIX domain-containing protein [Roseovarius sp. Pro17]|uniref:NUDIX domain-containing protein n=1 Tax=Roseovarius sp. Pro17 TaxID=3108175 RepID=UPI002D765137|nr:NUDIX domain-containing protein [Roseovarius sp. Pro17]
MSAIFLYGTLRDPALLQIVLGPKIDGAVLLDGILPDHAVTWAEGQVFPTITAQAGAEATGVLLDDPGAELLARLDFYEGGFGYDLKPVKVMAGGATHPARVYFPRPGLWQPGARFELADWQEKWGALSHLAAIEAMGYLGLFTAEELASRMPMIRARAASRLAATGVPAQVRCDIGADAVQQIETRIDHAGFFRSETRRLRHPKFDGTMSEEVSREVFIATDAAHVLPYDPGRDRVLLIEQFRLGPLGRGDPRPWMLEPVAGRVDPGETPEQAAHRECMEEAGLTLTRLERIASYYCTPGYSTEYFHNFVGIADLPDDLPRLGGLKSEAEDIRLHILDFAAAMALLDTGEADNGPLILSLMWLARERGRLRAAP